MSGIPRLVAAFVVPAPLRLAVAAVASIGQAVPRPVWFACAALAIGSGAWHWHRHTLGAAYAAGSAAQAIADRNAYRAEANRAAAAQHDTVVALDTRQHVISKEADDVLTARHADLARRYDALRLRWAAYRAASGSAGADRTAAVPDAAGRADDAACAARGWVAFDTAAAAAHAADAAIAKDDAWISWAGAQAAAWPRPGTEP